jgi:predicted hydrocarbon binding protein
VHGLIFAELRKFVTGAMGDDAWPKLLMAAGLANKIYMPVATYPDEEIFALVTAATTMTGTTGDAILQSFGEFMAPDLLRMYAGRISKDWKTLDIIEHTEETIHSVVRVQNPGAEPPRLQCHRRSATEVVITYTSQRKLCAVAKGIALGVARDLREKVTITESRCMNRGAPACEIVVALEPEAA